MAGKGIALVTCLMLTVACSGSGSPSAASRAAPSATAQGSPAPSVAASAPPAARTTASPRPGIRKVLAIVEENHSLAQMRSGMPYLEGLAERYGYATHYRALTHPSLPNYLAIAGGSTFGVQDDSSPSAHRISGRSVFGQTLSAGGTARLYAESLRAPCATASSGDFAVRHAPWAYFVDERQECIAGMVDAGTPAHGALAADIRAGTLPTTGMLVPDLENDAHDGTLAQADRWLERWLPELLTGPDFRSGRLAIVITADEDDNTAVNRVLTVLLARDLAHRVVTQPLSHYSLTRFFDDVAGAEPLREATTATDLGTAFGLPVGR